MKIHLYFEQVLLDNMLMDFALLFCTRIIAGRRQKNLRMLAAAGIGALYACLMPVIPFLNFFPLKLALPAVMSAAAFFSKTQKGCAAAALIFMLLTAVSGGAAFGLSYIFEADMLAVPGGFFTAGYKARGILLGLSAALIASGGAIKLIKKRRRIISGEARLIISSDLGEIALHAFIDSGNCLKDQYSGLPVAIVSQESVKQILDGSLISLLEGRIPQNPSAVHIISYKGINQSGVLYGFKPNGTQIIKEGKTYKPDCILAVSRNKSFCGEYEAVIHPDMLEEAAI